VDNGAEKPEPEVLEYDRVLPHAPRPVMEVVSLVWISIGAVLCGVGVVMGVMADWAQVSANLLSSELLWVAGPVFVGVLFLGGGLLVKVAGRRGGR
jgi:hypothetical protein